MALEEETTLDELEKAEAKDDAQFGDDPLDADIDVVVDDEDTPDDEVTPEPAPTPVAAPEIPEPADATVTDADLEAGDHAYPEPIKKRIKREIRIRKKAQEDVEQMRGAAVQAVQYAQSKDTELVAAREQVRALQKQHADVLDLAFDKDIQLKRIALKAAREEGKSDDEMAIQGDLNTLQFQQNQIRDVKRTLASAPAPTAPVQTPAAQTPSSAAPTREPPAPLAVQWLQKNNTWFSNPEYVGHKHFVLGVDAQLVKEGYDKNSPMYYSELDKRVDKAFPSLRKSAVVPPAAGSSPPVAPVGAGGSKTVAKGTIRLTKDDLRNMRRFGLDPSNKGHLREYAMSKRSST